MTDNLLFDSVEDAFRKASDQLRKMKEENKKEFFTKVYEPHFALIVDNKVHSVYDNYNDCENVLFEMIIDKVYKNCLNNPHVVRDKNKYTLYNSTLLFLITYDQMVSTYRIKKIPKITVSKEVE